MSILSCLKIARICIGVFGIATSSLAAVAVQTAQVQGPPDLSKQMLSGNYSELLKPLDIYAPPPASKKLISLTELYQLVQSRGLALKVSRETFNAANQSVKTEDDKKIPVISMDAGHDQRWTKVLSDSDSTDDFSDRKNETGSRSLSARAGLSLNGSPLRGVSYKLAFPQLAHSQTMPEGTISNPPRRDSGAFTAGVDVSLLRDNPLSSEGLSRQRSALSLLVARETFRQEVIAKISDAESAFFSLIQRYLQLSVQQRSVLLAKALEVDVKEKIAAGESSALEATRAELQAAQSQTDYMSSEIEFEAAVAEFRNSLAFSESDDSGVFPDPKSLNVDVESFTIPSDATRQIVIANPRVVSARVNKEIAEIDAKISRVSTLPSLSFSMNYGNTTPGDGWGATTGASLKPNDRSFSVGLSYSQILFNDTSKNSLQQAVVASQKATFAEDETKRQVEKEFNALVKRLDIGSRRYRIAKISREIAEKKLNSEYERFKAGESSVRNVIDSQTEVNGARIGEIGVRVDLLSSIGKMRALLGKLPDGLALNFSR